MLKTKLKNLGEHLVRQPETHETHVETHLTHLKTSGNISERMSDVCVHACVYSSVLYVERSRQHRWRCAEVTFTCPEEALCQRWVSSIREQLAAISTTSQQHTLYNTHMIAARYSLTSLLFCSQQTQKPAGLHQPVRREATGQTHLWAEGRPTVRPSRHLHTRHRYVPYHSPLVTGLSASRIVSLSTLFLFVVVIVTEYANYARDHLRAEAELKKFDGWVSSLYLHLRARNTCKIANVWEPLRSNRNREVILVFFKW